MHDTLSRLPDGWTRGHLDGFALEAALDATALYIDGVAGDVVRRDNGLTITVMIRPTPDRCERCGPMRACWRGLSRCQG